MRSYQLAVAIGIALGFGFFTQANGQNPYRNPYSSPDWLRRPTFSPWLELYREDSGVLPNYHQFVRPRQRMQRYLLERDRQLQRQQIQMRQMQRQQAATEQLQRQMRAPQQQQNYRIPTGTGSTFMSYGYFMNHRGYFGAGSR